MSRMQTVAFYHLFRLPPSLKAQANLSCNRQENSARNYDPLSVGCADHSGPCLDVIYRSLWSSDDDPNAQVQWLLQKQENARKKILENILGSKPNRHASTASPCISAECLQGFEADDSAAEPAGSTFTKVSTNRAGSATSARAFGLAYRRSS